MQTLTVQVAQKAQQNQEFLSGVFTSHEGGRTFRISELQEF